MPAPENSLDVLGIKPVGEAISTITTATTEGAGAFLGRICLPAAEEFGLFLQDKVRSWRAKNVASIAAKAEAKARQLPDFEKRFAHPRIVGAIIEHGSWADEDLVQDMWAGLLASACTTTGDDQQNFVFVSILGQLTPIQAQVLQFVCATCNVSKSASGLVVADRLQIPVSNLLDLLKVHDIHQLDLELDHLRGLGLIDIASGLSPDEEIADLGPTAIGLQLYIRSKGFIGSPLAFYGL